VGKGSDRRKEDSNKISDKLGKVKKTKDFTPKGEPKKSRKGGKRFGPY